VQINWPSESFNSWRPGKTDKEVIIAITAYIDSFENFQSKEFTSSILAISSTNPESKSSIKKAFDQASAQLKKINNGNEQSICEFSEYILLSIACAVALKQNTTEGIWRSIVFYSSIEEPLEFILPLAIIAMAHKDEDFSAKLVKLTKSGLKKNASEGPSAVEKRANAFLKSQKYWLENRSLSKLWHGLSWEAEDPFSHLWNRLEFRVLASLSLDDFSEVLSTFSEPNCIYNGLIASEADHSFEVWAHLLKIAPPSFDQHGNWNNELVAPLLLYIALSQHNKYRDALARAAEGDKDSQHLDTFNNFSKLIFSAISQHVTFEALSAHWLCYLLKTSITQSNPSEPSNSITCRTLTYQSLIEAAGPSSTKLPSLRDFQPEIDSDELWLYRSVLTILSENNDITYPCVKSFIEDWAITYENWSDSVGTNLRTQADIFIPSTYRASSLPSRVLAYPFTQERSPATHWLELWDSTWVLREIVEFGDANPDRPESWRQRHDAERLVTLAFNIGLSALDLMADNEKPSVKFMDECVSLFSGLVAASEEMLSLQHNDDKFWAESRKNLALRRLLWSGEGKATSSAILSRAKPSFESYLQWITPDSLELLNVLYLSVKNKYPSDLLITKIISSGIDLEEKLRAGELLKKTHPRKFPLSDSVISVIQDLINNEKLMQQD